MDGLDLDLYEPLSYGDEEEEETALDKLRSSSGRKRSTSESADIETPAKRSSKRQRVEEVVEVSQTSSVCQKTSQIQVEDDSDDSDAFVIDFDEEAAEAADKAQKDKASTTSVEITEILSGSSARAKGTQISHRDSVFTPSPPSSPTPITNGGSVPNTAQVEPDLFPKFRRVLKRIPHDIPYLPVTCEDGSRLYLRLKEKPVETDDDAANVKLTCGKNKRNLIEGWDKIKAEARIIKDKFHKSLAKAVSDEIFTTDTDRKNVSPSSGTDSLWVEKYKPKSFLDLLSLEAVNRGLLHWIKLWDKSVFGRDYLSKIKATRQKYAKLEQIEKERDEKFQRKTYVPQNEEYDDSSRPSVKIALLSGDPGLGKTTLAHVIAKHAGYKVLEMNASDDRSTDVFRKALVDTEEKTELMNDGKPKCLIIDEIDGAPAASVKVLIDYACGNLTEKGKKKKRSLKRPVICICNDLYAPALKELKKLAFIIQFPQIPIPRLVERLMEVATVEQVYVDQNTLQTLCQVSECDVRSCLSTLQFLKRGLCTTKEALAKVGTKDRSKGIFSVWHEIFTLPQEKRYQDRLPDPSKPANRFWNTLQTVQTHGEYDRLFGGVFENYLRIRYKDIYLQSVLEGLEWAVWLESIQEFTVRTQNYSMYGFLPMFFVMAHFLFARRDVPKLHFPSQEFATKIPRLQGSVKTQISETTPAIARFLDPYMLITDVYPAILGVIQPCSIRPVPTQIWTQKERDTLKNVVDIMLTYNLTYTQTKHPDTGAYSFVLEPNLEEIAKFKGDDSSTRKPFPYAIKQVIAREIETEKLRRNDMIPEIVEKNTFKVPQTPKPFTSEQTTPKSKALDALNKKGPSIIGRDFFGRPIMPTVETSPETEAKKKSSVAVYFRFKEGYSNAVRRYVKMKDL